MLKIVVPACEFFDEINEVFLYKEEQTLTLEHSLVSISKWESKWNKPFLGKQEKTEEETIDYIRCMTITQNVNPDVYVRLSSENFNDINSYIESPMTATRFFEEGRESKIQETITSEIIYYWMIALNIPIEFQKWHLNRLLTLIRVCEVKNRPAKKRSQTEIMKHNAALNAARRKRLNSKG